jgi:nucleoside-diphosphate-sugar epimerase
MNKRILITGATGNIGHEVIRYLMELKSDHHIVAGVRNSEKAKITFVNVSLFNFYRLKKKQGLETGLIIVMMLLHYLPRFQKEPVISDFYEQLIGKKPTDLKKFISRECWQFEPYT